MSSSLDRRMRRRKLKNTITVCDNVDESLVQECLDSKLEVNKVKNVYKDIEKHHDMEVSDKEVSQFLEQFKKDFTQDKFNKLISDCKKDVITSIVTPFGLGTLMSAYDKTGGNVDTIHNAREGVYATEKAKENYAKKSDYNSHEYHSHPEYIKNNKEYSELRKSGEVSDYMTGEKLDRNKSHDLDHVVSAKEIHDDTGRVLAGIDGSDLANRKENLKPTSATNNRSKKADSMKDFIERKNTRIEKIDILKSKPNKTQQEKNELRKLEELNKIDDEKALSVDKEARDTQNKEINSTYYTSPEFAKNTAIAGLQEGTGMGIQQAMGLVIVEFFTALFDEVLDIYHEGYKNGFDNDGFFTILKKRLARIAKRLTNKWKDVAIAFKDGAISGFISSLVTTVINVFVTTAKRVARIIREGIFSLFRAVKLLLFPPKGMSYEQAMHEAKKLISTGIIISLGVLLEEAIDAMIKGTAVLAPFADILTGVFVGAITGLAVTMTVYYIDKKKDDKDMGKQLMADTTAKFDNLDKLLGHLEYDIVRNA